MKVRVRGFDSKQTLKLEIPDNASFQHLKNSIALAIHLPSPSSLRLSLNRTDEISPPSPDDSIRSLGIASGDLLFYSVVAGEASTSQSDPSAGEEMIRAQVISQNPATYSVAGKSEEQEKESDGIEEESMEIEEDFDWFFPESCFVRRLIRVLGDNFGENHLEQKLIISAVHSVFFESGFVLAVDEKLRFPSSMAFIMSVRYTLPEIVSPSKEGSAEIESVVLKFQIMRNFVNVYGHLTKPGSGSTFHICLDSLRFAPVISSLRLAATGATGEDLEREVFELWKMVRDRLALPLKIDLCAQAGLAGPACFARLPLELLSKIVELLPGCDVARAGCTCRDLAYLARDDGLWRRKYEEEFGEPAPASGRPKIMYAQVMRAVEEEKERGKRRREWRGPHHLWQHPLGAPGTGGGIFWDYPRFGGGGRGRLFPLGRYRGRLI